MTTESSKTTKLTERYKVLAQEYRTLREREDSLLGEMDSLWWSMTSEEQDTVDPQGAAYRAPHNRNNKPEIRK